MRIKKTKLIKGLWILGILLIAVVFYKVIFVKKNPTIALEEPFKGAKNASVTIIEFSDFQCPYCGKAYLTLKKVEDYYGNKIKIVYRNFPLTLHEHAQKAAEAGECANEQGKFWEMHDKMFENQKNLKVNDLKKYAAEISLNMKQFNSCLKSGKYAWEVKQDTKEGKQKGVTSTPTFFINNKKLVGAKPFDKFKEIIDSEMG